MYCRECGQKLKNDDKVCPKCGAPIDHKEESKIVKKVKSNKKIFIILGIVCLIIIIMFIVFNHKSIVGIYKQSDGVGTTIIINKDKSCNISFETQNDNYPTTISNCYWTMKNDKITIYFTMSVSSYLVPSYTRDNQITGTFDGKNITMDEGSIYYRQ